VLIELRNGLNFGRTDFRHVSEFSTSIGLLGSAMAQVVSRRPLTAEARVRARVNPCGICGGQSDTETGFSPSSSVFPSIYHSTVALQTHIIWGMRNMPAQRQASTLGSNTPHLQENNLHWFRRFARDGVHT
jgi:hypothetical protein